MTDVLVDGRVIPVPPGWVIRVTLERVADGAHPTTTRGGDAAFSRLTQVKEPGDGGARPAGTELEPTIDEIDPLPVMAKRHRENGGGKLHARRGTVAATPAPAAVAPKTTHPLGRGGYRGKPCPNPKCDRRCGPRARACPTCGTAFPPERKVS